MLCCRFDLNDITPACLQANSKTGNFMYRPVKYLLHPNCGTLSKVIVAVATIFLSLTIIGLLVVIPGVIEWNRQIKANENFNQNQLDNKPPTYESWSDRPPSVRVNDIEEIREKINHYITVGHKLNLAKPPKDGINSMDLDPISMDKYCDPLPGAGDIFFGYLKKKNIITHYFSTRCGHVTITFDMEKLK